MRDRMEVVVCDQEGCPEQMSGPAVHLMAAARAAGWQIHEIRELSTDDDGPDVTFTDRCPAHHVPVVAREEALRVAGGPGGLQPHNLW